VRVARGAPEASRARFAPSRQSGASQLPCTIARTGLASGSTVTASTRKAGGGAAITSLRIARRSAGRSSVLRTLIRSAKATSWRGIGSAV
jgi:hypothetical protein